MMEEIDRFQVPAVRAEMQPLVSGGRGRGGAGVPAWLLSLQRDWGYGEESGGGGWPRGCNIAAVPCCVMAEDMGGGGHHKMWLPTPRLWLAYTRWVGGWVGRRYGQPRGLPVGCLVANGFLRVCGWPYSGAKGLLLARVPATCKH